MRKVVVILSACVALSQARAAAASTVSFDPDGAGPIAAAAIDSLDPLPGNALSVGLNGGSSVGSTGLLLFQANLGNATIGGNPAFATNFGAPAGCVAPNCSPSFNFTAIITEQITSNSAGTLGFGFAAGTQTFQMWARPLGSPNANNLTGACFGADSANSCGNILILSGTFVNDATFSGSFKADNGGLPPVTCPHPPGADTPPPCALDEFNANNYPGINTVTGTGSFKANIQITSHNNAYFPGLVDNSTFVFSTSEQSLAFGTVDPSACFFWTDAPLTNGHDTGNCGAPGSTLGANAAEIGTVNGAPAANGGGFNTMLATDSSLSFNAAAVVVPEPATLTLIGLGLVGSAAARRRQLRKKK